MRSLQKKKILTSTRALPSMDASGSGSDSIARARKSSFRRAAAVNLNEALCWNHFNSSKHYTGLKQRSSQRSTFHCFTFTLWRRKATRAGFPHSSCPKTLNVVRFYFWTCQRERGILKEDCGLTITRLQLQHPIQTSGTLFFEEKNIFLWNFQTIFWAPSWSLQPTWSPNTDLRVSTARTVPRSLQYETWNMI